MYLGNAVLHVSAGTHAVAVDHESAAFHVDARHVAAGSVNYEFAAGKTFAAVVTRIAHDLENAALHPRLDTAVSGTAVMRGIPVTEDFAALHLTPEPAVGIARYLD